MRKFVWGSAIVTAALLLAPAASAQEPATVVLLDGNAIDINAFAAADVNATVADIGVRDALPYFNVREGQPVALAGGSPGHEGWIALTAIPSGWSSSGEADGLENFIWAGPGLGSPDAAGSRTSLLGVRPEAAPLGSTGLQMLVGRTVCAVAYRGELPRSAAGVMLSGATLGILAFSVEAVSGSESGALPSVVVNVRETRQVCSGALTPMSDAPAAGL